MGRQLTCFLSVLAGFFLPGVVFGLDLPKDLGKETAECVRCHREHTPGVVADWAKSRHAWTRPEAAYEKSPSTRRLSAEKPPEAFKGKVVGCFECHGQNPDSHTDTFDHLGYRVHVVVTPKDCETCHPVEAGEFARSRKAFGYENLAKNPLNSRLADTLAGTPAWAGGRLVTGTATEEAKAQACGGCHGAPVTVTGTGRTRTAMGEVEFAQLANWPNQGVGRLNPDGSRGACSACHSRHAFAIEDARHPETCARCHRGGHSPADEAYQTSAHGALYRAREPEFDWGNVPWVLGQDFTVPTCAACHASQIVNERGAPLARRTHDYGARLWVRLAGAPYSHPSPARGETHNLRNAEGQPWPTGLDGTPVAQGLLAAGEQEDRKDALLTLCAACHGGPLPWGQFEALERVNRETDAGVRAATDGVREGWKRGAATPENLFDEPLERLWVEVWFLDAAALRYAAAMGGAPGSGLGRGLRALEKELGTPAPAAAR